MTIDYDVNEYIKVGNYSNILFGYDKEHKEDRIGWTPYLHERMQSLLHKLSMAHPDWTFVTRHGARDAVNKCWRNVHDTIVICDDEVIGEIKLDTWKNGTPFEIDCPAISAARSRRGGAWTTKLEKAYKLVEENFRPMQLAERLHRARQSAISTIGSNVWAATRKLNNNMNNLEEPLAAYIVAHVEELKREFPAKYAPDLEAVAPQLAEFIEAKRLNNAVQNNTGTMVIVHGDTYYLSNDGFSNFVSLASHELPEDIAGKIGVLKAFDQDGVAVETIGIRTNKNTYFIP